MDIMIRATLEEISREVPIWRIRSDTQEGAGVGAGADGVDRHTYRDVRTETGNTQMGREPCQSNILGLRFGQE